MGTAIFKKKHDFYGKIYLKNEDFYQNIYTELGLYLKIKKCLSMGTSIFKKK